MRDIESRTMIFSLLYHYFEEFDRKWKRRAWEKARWKKYRKVMSHLRENLEHYHQNDRDGKVGRVISKCAKACKAYERRRIKWLELVAGLVVMAFGVSILVMFVAALVLSVLALWKYVVS